MKKLTVLTATLLSAASLAGQPLTAQAASERASVAANGNRVIVTYSNASSCNITALLEKLQNCFPGSTLPDCNLPDSSEPDSNTPETNTPDTSLPGDNAPELEDSSQDLPSHQQYIQQIVSLVNAERAKVGLNPVSLDVKVQAAAQVRAVECEQSFSHTRPNGTSFTTALKEQNVSYRGAGENIAWGQRSPQEVMNAWMNSSGHRANILNSSYTTIGVGYYQNANGVNYWSQLFTY